MKTSPLPQRKGTGMIKLFMVHKGAAFWRYDIEAAGWAAGDLQQGPGHLFAT